MKPLRDMTEAERVAYVDAHLVMALEAAELDRDRQLAEDYLRDRLVAVSDSWPTREQLAAERSRAQRERLAELLARPTGAVLRELGVPQPGGGGG